MSPEQVLSNLPLILTVWTCASFLWGTLVAIIYSKIARRKLTHLCCLSTCGKCQLIALWAANAVLLAFLIIDHTIGCSFGDAVTVINVFYDTYLMCAMPYVFSWFKQNA